MTSKPYLSSQQMRTLRKRWEKDVEKLRGSSDILAKGLELTPGIRLPERAKTDHEQISHILWHHFHLANEEKAGSKTRRNSLEILRRLRSLIRSAVEEEDKFVSISLDSSTEERQKAATEKENEKLARNNGAPNDGAKAGHQLPRPAPPKPAAVTQLHPRTSSITLPNGKLSLTNFCNQKGAYVDAGTVADIPADNTSQKTTLGAGPPAYQHTSPNFGVQEYEKSRKPSKATAAGDHDKRRLDEAKRQEEEKQLAQAKKIAEDKRKREEAQRQEEQRKLAEKKRKEEEVKRAAIAKRKLEEAKRQEEQRKLAEQKRIEKQRKMEEEKKKKEEARKAAEKKKKLEEQRRQAEERRKNLAAQKRKEEIDAVMRAAMAFPTREKRVNFPRDSEPCKSGGLSARPTVDVKYRPMHLDRTQGEELSTRLNHWDPNWKVKKYIICGQTSPAIVAGQNRQVVCVNFSVKPQDCKNVDWGVTSLGAYETGHHRLILRMIPLKPESKDRADCHLWPKGTFCCVTSSSDDGETCVPLPLRQRKQQQHDAKKWSGTSDPYDLTRHIPHPSSSSEIKILTYDAIPYFICLSICEYNAPTKLFLDYINASPSEGPFQKLSKEEAAIKAKTFTETATLAIDSDDEMGGQDDSMGKFVFTLTCPFSKKIMETPVRGKLCKHYQCMDLKNFLESNRMVSGQRWRCLVCEKHISYYDLQFDGLVSHTITEFSKDLQAVERDRIEYYSDGSYTLLPARKQRQNSKKRPLPDSSKSTATAAKKAKPRNAEPEIILLDDD